MTSNSSEGVWKVGRDRGWAERDQGQEQQQEEEVTRVVVVSLSMILS
jgi:hypothetical protein